MLREGAHPATTIGAQAKLITAPFTVDRPVRLVEVQLYLLSVLFIAALSFSLSSSHPGLMTVTAVFGTSALLVGSYALIHVLLKRHAFSAVVMVGLLTGLPFLALLRYPVALAGLVGLVLLARPWRSLDARGLLALPLLTVAIFASGIYIDFQYEKHLNAGNLNMDSLFHAAIAAMYKNYGIPSLGLDGLVPVGYHTLSHKVMAGLATFSGLDVLAAYAHLTFVLGPLLLAFCLAGLAVQVNPRLSFSLALISVGMMMLIVPSLLIFREAALWDSYLASESYLLSLVMFVAALSALFRYREHPEKYALMFAAMLLMVLSGMAKGSSGVLGFCALGFFGLTVFRTVRYWLALAVASALMYWLVIDAAKNANAFMSFTPTHFVTIYVRAFVMESELLKLLFFLFFHCLPVWLCLGMGFALEGKKYARSNEFLTLFALLLPGLTLALAWSIPGGSAYYFSSVPVVIAFALLASKSDRLTAGNWPRVATVLVVCAIGFAVSREFDVFGKAANPYVFFCVLLILAASNFSLLSRNVFFVLTLAFSGYLLTSTVIRERTVFAKAASSEVDASTLFDQLREVRRTTPVETRIKMENPELLSDKIGCKAYWAFPAILERPMVGNLPRPPICDYLNGTYGLGEYGHKAPVAIELGERSVHLRP
jgi:hypothetical protein